MSMMRAPKLTAPWVAWFAWHPVNLSGKWVWLQWVARDQYANRPSLYRYGRIVTRAALKGEAE